VAVRRSVIANNLEFALLAEGQPGRPLALCLHGFPDSAHTWRHLLPALAEAGYYATAPFMRGYAPTAIPADGNYQTGALAADANALHEALGADETAVIIGHDWGAAAYGAVGSQPERWRRAVTLAVPPAASLSGFLTYDQLRRSWYTYFFQSPLAESVVAAEDLAFVGRLWADWSPGYDATWDLAQVRAALGNAERLRAAIGYYRATANPASHDPALAVEQAAISAPTPRPTLYLHGSDDGCLSWEAVGDPLAFLAEGSEVVVVEGAGHFLHLEAPKPVATEVTRFLSA
jgi:pimeloyl-ACP methyl ester carboxylesterase